MFRRLGLIVLLGVVSACTQTAHLYPANDVAATGGVLEAHFIANGTGHTKVQVIMPDGELLTGEATVVRGGSRTFGTIWASVYGPHGVANGSADTSSSTIPGSSPGTADMFGDRGTGMQCEFMNDNFGGHGNGACRSSKGGLYRLQY